MRAHDLEELNEGAIRDALDALQDENVPIESRAFQAECILEEALEDLS